MPLLRLFALALVLSFAAPLHAQRSAVFLHPDGMGANTWMALRLDEVGPDGRLAWDQLSQTAVYVGPVLDDVTASSNAGATSHAWGVRVGKDSYGWNDGQPLRHAASGFRGTVMTEALRAGKRVGVVNTSSVTEPGTGAFLASVADRDDETAIAAQILASGAHVILGGGEQFFLPAGVRGAHGQGVRGDGRNLIEEARRKGYAVVRTRDELAALPANADKVLGLFAAEDTFNEGTEAQLAAAGLPPFQPQAPRFDEMIEAAMRILSRADAGYLLVGNEEATDNFGGDNNAVAVIEAAAGADRAIGIVQRQAMQDPELTVVVASDSDCGGMNVSGGDIRADGPVPPRLENGSPVDGREGRPFLAAPDAQGRRLPFVVAWSADGDVSGAVIARGSGPGASLLRGTIDSTDIYRALHLGLFGRQYPAASQ